MQYIELFMKHAVIIFAVNLSVASLTQALPTVYNLVAPSGEQNNTVLVTGAVAAQEGFLLADRRLLNSPPTLNNLLIPDQSAILLPLPKRGDGNKEQDSNEVTNGQEIKSGHVKDLKRRQGSITSFFDPDWDLLNAQKPEAAQQLEGAGND